MGIATTIILAKFPIISFLSMMPLFNRFAWYSSVASGDSPPLHIALDRSWPSDPTPVKIRVRKESRVKKWLLLALLCCQTIGNVDFCLDEPLSFSPMRCARGI